MPADPANSTDRVELSAAADTPPDPHAPAPAAVRALVFANGALNDGPAVQAALRHAPGAHIIGADGGARLALACDLTPDVVVGDMDSLSGAELDALGARGTAVERYSPHKDETDLELALHTAVARGAAWIRILGAVGDRLDQTFANLYLLLLPALDGRDVRLVAGAQTLWVVAAGEHTLSGAAGDTISLLPLGGAAQGIRTGGLEYPLRDETLTPGPARGISNVMQGATAQLRLRAGRLIVVHTRGRA